MKNQAAYSAFLASFAASAQLRDSEAEEQWSAYSRCLPDSEREHIERGGAKSGACEGETFLSLYPVADRDETL